MDSKECLPSNSDEEEFISYEQELEIKLLIEDGKDLFKKILDSLQERLGTGDEFKKTADIMTHIFTDIYSDRLKKINIKYNNKPQPCGKK